MAGIPAAAVEPSLTSPFQSHCHPIYQEISPSPCSCPHHSDHLSPLPLSLPLSRSSLSFCDRCSVLTEELLPWPPHSLLATQLPDGLIISASAHALLTNSKAQVLKGALHNRPHPLAEPLASMFPLAIPTNHTLLAGPSPGLCTGRLLCLGHIPRCS